MSPRQLAVVLALLAGAAARAERHEDPCARAFGEQAWARVVARCPGGSPQAALGRAWLDYRAGRGTPEVDAEALLGSSVGDDAALLAGRVRGESGDFGEQARGRALLRRALAGYQRTGRHVDAAGAAGYLSRTPAPDALFEDALAYATLAVELAMASGQARAIGAALTDLAEVYDDIGMLHEAKDTFFRAEEFLQGSPGKLAFAYMKHGIFLVDQATTQARHAGLEYLRAAREIARSSAVDAFTRDLVEYSVRLNAATAYADLGDRAKAEAELVAEPVDEEQRRTLLLTRGFLAARADRLAEAEALFAAADAARYGLDTGWWMALELARAYRRVGRGADAERYFRAAIAIVEDLRDAGARPKLRPFVLSRRAAAYTELVALLAEQRRGLDALVVAESLHARTWLDEVLGSRPDRLISTSQWLREAEIRARHPAQPALDAAGLLASLGDREALVVLHAGDAYWRAHVLRGNVAIAPIAADELDAILDFRDRPGERAAAEAAAHALLPPTVTDRSDPLYVVADGALADVPFAALPVGDQPLVARRAMVRIPGLAALGCRPRVWQPTQVFIGDAAGDLPGAAAEVRRLGGAVARTGDQATLAAIRSAADATLLHVAVHGRATATGGALQLADGLLSTAEVVDAALGPRTVMLTGCATTTSADAEAWTGFPSAFLASGSRYVVATLRAVPDAGAAEMIAAYYRQPSALSPPERLAAAQRAVAATLPVEVWSAFTGWGDAACGE